MVATVVELRSSALAVSYYEKDGYYAKDSPEHRDASFWAGAAARDAGLRAHVLPREFEDVLSGWVPGTELRLGRMREGERDHRPGWDITFSAPKSVSLEALVTGDRRVIRAHDDAVRATLGWIESELLETRGWDPATRRRPRVKADGMVVAGFRHLTSRDQDPQLHTHCVLANMTRNPAGEWRSVEPTRIRRSVRLIGAYYRNELARRLQALEMAVTPTLVGNIPGFELAGYGRSFLDAFSGRRREILAHLERLGLPYTPALAQMAALHTRRRKRDTGLAELVPAWRARARALGLRRDKAALRPARPLDPDTGKPVPPPEVPAPDLPANELRSLRRAPKLPPLPPNPRESHAPAAGTAGEVSAEPETGVLEAVARAVAHAAERRTTIPEAEIRAVALGHAPGRYGLDEIDAAIARLVAGGELIAVERRGMDRAFVTDGAVKAERRILASMRAGRGTGAALADAATVEARLGASRLTAGQREAVRTVLLSDDLVVGVQGHAGSGKTTMLRTAKALLGGRTILGLAPSAAAARVLEREAGVRSRTLQYFLTRFADLADDDALARAREEYGGAVLAVDEASMIDTVRMQALLAIAARLGVARVALVGDTAQLRAVDAGQPFRLLQKAGMRTATMDEVLRQRDPELLSAVGLARGGEAGEAIRTLGGERVIEAAREDLGREAARRWLALPPGERGDTLLLAPTHAIRRQANEAAREGLAREGRLHGRTLTVDRLVDRRLTRAQAADIASYEPGDTVVLHRDHYGCRKDDVCVVTGREGGMVAMAHPDGGERRFRPAGNAAWYLRLCDTERIELCAGDRIRWTRNRKAPPRRFDRPRAPDLVNGGEAEIVGIGYERVRFRDADGTVFGLARGDPQLRHLDHAYCTTVHAAQGRTARAAIAVLDAGGAADRALFHVELSRVSEEFVLLTDDRETLVERLESSPGGEDGALEALGVDPAHEPAVDPDVLADLADDWRTLRRRAEETDTVPFFVSGYNEVMARAAALSAVEDLPADMRAPVDAMLAEHDAHLARGRAIRSLMERIGGNWRRWPELGWAARAKGCPVEALPGHAAWRAEGAALAGEARTLLAGGENIDTARHLRAAPDGRAALEGAVRSLERTRTVDDGERFRRLWADLRERAARTGVPELLAPGHAGAAALGERLEAAAGLDAETRRAVADWRAVRTAQTALADEVRTLPGRAAAWERRRAELPLDRHGGIDPADPACRDWRGEGARIARSAAAMLQAGTAHAPWLDATPETRPGIALAAGAVRGALTEDRYAGLAWLTREVDRMRRETGAPAFRQPRYGEAIAEARTLAGEAGLPRERRQAIERWLAYDREHGRLAADVRAWPGRAEALIAERPGAPARIDALADWRDRAAALLDEAAAMGAPDGPHAPHLAAMPAESAALDAAQARLDATLVDVGVREVRALETMARRHAALTGGIAFDAPDHAAAVARARALDVRPGLPADARATVDAILARDARWRTERQRIAAFLDAAAAPGSDAYALAGIAREAAAIGRDVAEPDIAAHLAALGGTPGAASGAAPGAAPDALGAIAEAAAARVAADRRARLLERIARNRDRARQLGIAEFDTAGWPAIADDARALLDARALPAADRTRLERILGREAAHRAEEPKIPSPRHDPGIGF